MRSGGGSSSGGGGGGGFWQLLRVEGIEKSRDDNKLRRRPGQSTYLDHRTVAQRVPYINCTAARLAHIPQNLPNCSITNQNLRSSSTSFSPPPPLSALDLSTLPGSPFSPRPPRPPRPRDVIQRHCCVLLTGGSILESAPPFRASRDQHRHCWY